MAPADGSLWTTHEVSSSLCAPGSPVAKLDTGGARLRDDFGLLVLLQQRISPVLASKLSNKDRRCGAMQSVKSQIRGRSASPVSWLQSGASIATRGEEADMPMGKRLSGPDML